MNAILERVLNDKPRENGKPYRKFESRTSGFATSYNELVVKHYVHHVVACHDDEIGDYFQCNNDYTYELTIREYGGVWWVVWWSDTSHLPNYLPWNYVTAEDALNAMLTISDVLIA